jgi:hypothetical protein
MSPVKIPIFLIQDVRRALDPSTRESLLEKRFGTATAQVRFPFKNRLRCAALEPFKASGDTG